MDSFDIDYIQKVNELKEVLDRKGFTLEQTQRIAYELHQLVRKEFINKRLCYENM